MRGGEGGELVVGEVEVVDGEREQAKMVWCGCERPVELRCQSRFAGALDSGDAEEERGGGGSSRRWRASAVRLEEGQEEGDDGGGFVADDDG